MRKFLFILVTLICAGLVIYAGVMQCVLSYEKFGVIFGGGSGTFIPDKSALCFLGAIGLVPAMIWLAN